MKFCLKFQEATENSHMSLGICFKKTRLKGLTAPDCLILNNIQRIFYEFYFQCSVLTICGMSKLEKWSNTNMASQYVLITEHDWQSYIHSTGFLYKHGGLGMTEGVYIACQTKEIFYRTWQHNNELYMVINYLKYFLIIHILYT